MIDPYIITTLQLIGCMEIAYVIAKWIEDRERKQYKIRFDKWYHDRFIRTNGGG